MTLRKTLPFLVSLLFVFQSVAVIAQADSSYWDYIRKWSRAAIDEMYYSKIPASITMAQALHESRYGTSELAVKANNHFGIKCQTGWDGRTYKYQDDDANTCFRHYESAAQSYRDHSDFLMSRPRYARLFQLDPYDYVGWAKGLKECGYATNPAYATILIKLVEDYKLYQLDNKQTVVEPMNSISDRQIPNFIPDGVAPEAKVSNRNRIKFVVAARGDNIKSLTKKLDMKGWQIRAYNEIPRNQDLKAGQIVYLQPKRRQSEPSYSRHTVEKGETMYSISQTYGIRIKWLYKRNGMKFGSQPKPGQEIWLRGMKPNRR
jgi:LysM repeat protein